MKFAYKSNLLILLLILISVIGMGQINYFCQSPIEKYQFEQCNEQIAQFYAPVVYQWMSICGSDSEDGDSDRIVKVNFDNDWVATNNWEHIDNLRDSNFGYDNRPFGYYAVAWTENLWIIVYTFYYAKDYADDGLTDYDNFSCNDDEHEGDFVKTLVVVKRESYPEKPRVLAYIAQKESENCIDIKMDGDGPDDYNALLLTGEPFFEPGVPTIPGDDGTHPVISSAAGSHHQYSRYTRGFSDDGNPCKPWPKALTIYKPIPLDYYEPSEITGIDFGTFCSVHCWNASSMDDVENCTEHTEYYGLIDIFDEEEGLWEQRINEEMFTGAIDVAAGFHSALRNQRLLCDNGGGCNTPLGLLANTSPHAPWKGRVGMNPLIAVDEKLSGEFCPEFDIHDCSYVYNPYLCDFYEVLPTKKVEYQDNEFDNPHLLSDGTNLSFVIKFKLAAQLSYLESVPFFTGSFYNSISWDLEITGDMANLVSYELISSDDNNAIFLIQGVEPGNFFDNEVLVNVQATFSSPDCGTNTTSFELFTGVNNLIANTDCGEIIVKIAEEFHETGNSYDWKFPGYEDLATISPDTRKARFSTLDVKERLESTGQTNILNQEEDLLYSVEITNLIAQTENEIGGGFRFPQCSSGLNLVIYPNPSTDIMHLEFSGDKVGDQKDFDITILDYQLNLIHEINCPSANGSIDVSDLDSGLYYLYTTTKEGKVISKKFCIGEH